MSLLRARPGHVEVLLAALLERHEQTGTTITVLQWDLVFLHLLMRELRWEVRHCEKKSDTGGLYLSTHGRHFGACGVVLLRLHFYPTGRWCPGEFTSSTHKPLSDLRLNQLIKRH